MGTSQKSHDVYHTLCTCSRMAENAAVLGVKETAEVKGREEVRQSVTLGINAVSRRSSCVTE